MSRRFKIAFIVINYNSSDYTIDCVNSILQQTTPDLSFQIIVIDNNSRTEEFEKIIPLKKIINLSVIRSNINTGFSGANMLGVRNADADYYFFLNNDTLLLNDCASIFYNFLENTPGAANCSGQMIDANGLREPNFGYFPTLALKTFGSGALRLFNPEAYPNRHQVYNQAMKVDFVNGSAMFIKAQPFELIGGFDTNYFLYCEEEDIALRLRRKGFFTWWLPQAKYQHFVSRSTDSTDAIKLPFLKEFFISFFYYQRKNYNITTAVVLQILFFLKNIRKFYKDKRFATLAFFILRGAPMTSSLRNLQKSASTSPSSLNSFHQGQTN